MSRSGIFTFHLISALGILPPMSSHYVFLSRFMRRRILLPLFLFLVFILVLLILHFAGLTRFVTVENIEKMENLVRACGAWGPILFILLTIFGVALLSPAMPWVVLASVFGVGLGILYASIGITLGCGVAFLLARHAFRPTIRRMAGHTREFQQIDNGVRRHGWRMVMITRLVPVFPFNIQNYAYGLTGISFWTYLLMTWLCTLPPIAAYVFAAGAIIRGKGDVRRTLAYIGAGAMIFVMLSFVPRMLKKSAPAKELGDEKKRDLG